MADTHSKIVRDDTNARAEDASSDTPRFPPAYGKSANDDDSARRKDNAATDRIESIIK